MTAPDLPHLPQLRDPRLGKTTDHAARQHRRRLASEALFGLTVCAALAYAAAHALQAYVLRGFVDRLDRAAAGSPTDHETAVSVVRQVNDAANASTATTYTVYAVLIAWVILARAPLGQAMRRQPPPSAEQTWKRPRWWVGAAFAVVALSLVLGRIPYDASDLRGAAHQEMLIRIVNAIGGLVFISLAFRMRQIINRAWRAPTPDAATPTPDAATPTPDAATQVPDIP